MSGGERVEDTRTLQPGDPIRVVITGTVTTSAETLFGFLAGDAEPWGLLHDQSRSGIEVYRLPKPLPPEPPVGAEVLGSTRSGAPLVFERWENRGWATSIDGPMPWAVLLARYGPVRLLGDPIEAPR